MNEAGSYSERYLIELLASVLNQTELNCKTDRISWEMIFKISEYHHVSNLVYYKIISEDAKEAAPWKEKFKKRYLEAVTASENYQSLGKTLTDAMERAQISGLFLEESVLVKYYPYPEMRMPDPLYVLIERKDYKKTELMMRALGFGTGEEQRDDLGQSVKLYRRGVCRVIFLDRLNFSDRKMNHFFAQLLKSSQLKPGRRFVREMAPGILYIYLACRNAQRYAAGFPELRNLVDLWMYISKEGGRIPWGEIEDRLGKFKIDYFAGCFLKLSAVCFGEMNFPEDQAALRHMLRYLMSKGAKAREESGKFLPIMQNFADYYYRDSRRERAKMFWTMLFPGREYMATYFPSVKEHPLRLPAFWIIRGFRNWGYHMKRKYRERPGREEKETKESGDES